MIELYGSPTPSAYTVAIMLEEIGLNYSVFPVNKSNNEQLELEFLKTTPNNIFPVILDREGPEKKPLVIFEPGAILMYLAEKSGMFMPEKSSERFDVLQWLLFAVKRFNNEAKRIFTIIEKQLAENEFLAGEYSIADIATFPWVKEYERYGIDGDTIPSTLTWLEKVSDRKAVSKGLDALADLKE
jgi:GST-like protein